MQNWTDWKTNITYFIEWAKVLKDAKQVLDNFEPNLVVGVTRFRKFKMFDKSYFKKE